MLSLSKNRRQCYLSTLSKKPKSKTYLIFDSETELISKGKSIKEHKLKLICAKILILKSDGTNEEKESVIFWKISDFHFWLYQKVNEYYTLHILAHNTSYDITTCEIFKFLDIIKSKCIVFNPQHGSYFLKFSGKQFNIVIIDSLNWFLNSLENIGKEIKFPKGKMPKTKGISKEWLNYCLRDIDVVSEAMKLLSKYLSQFGLGDLRITRASISFTIYRKNFHHTNMLHTTNLKVLELEYESYIGGRTELFSHGKLPTQDYFYYDFNSLYPSVMRNNKFSIKIRRHFPKSNLDQLKRFIISYGCVGRVSVSVKEPIFPKKMGKFTCFPVGSFTTVLSTPELQYGLENGLITDCLELSVYAQKEIFTDFVDFFHSQKTKHRAENKLIWAYFDKLILNTLYGKFGQKINTLVKMRGKQKEQYNMYDEVNLKSKKITKIKIINYKKYREIKNQVGTYSIPSISSEVTSYARIKMLKVMKDIGFADIYYCDTDSILTNKRGSEIIKKKYLGNNIGDLVLEKKSKNVTLHGLKDYDFGDRVKRKSIPKKAKKLSNNSYSYTHFNTTIEGMKSTRANKMITIEKKKTLTRKYSKGILLSNGRVLPLKLKE